MLHFSNTSSKLTEFTTNIYGARDPMVKEPSCLANMVS